MTSTRDREALLAAVIADPEDDLVRLAFADALEEAGDPADLLRAEYIRYAIRVPHCSFLALTKDDPFPLLGMTPGPPVVIGNGEARVWMWGETDALGLVVSDLARGLDYREDRGFVSGVLCSVERWRTHGPRLAREHPIRTVRLAGKEPSLTMYDNGRGGHGWLPTDTRQACSLPRWLWKPLRGYDTSLSGRWKLYPAPDKAHAALSSAALAWARGAAS